MKKQTPLLVVSLIMNTVFIVIAFIYILTPFLDYSIVSKSLPRMCEYIKKSQPNDYKNIEVCNIGE